MVHAWACGNAQHPHEHALPDAAPPVPINRTQLPVDVILLNVREGSQRLHASRRVFETLVRENITTSVIHHITFAEGTPRCVCGVGGSLGRGTGVAGWVA